MKNRTLFLLIFIVSIMGIANGQTYHKFPTVDGFWKVASGDITCLDATMSSDICVVYQYVTTGDIIINNLTYQMIEQSARYGNPFDGNPYSYNWGTYWNHGYFGCYRNDTINKKVYFISKDSVNETLLYDFNLQLNDTLPKSYLYDRQEIFTIDSIDSILVNNSYLKRFHILNAGFGNDYLIEGIGSTMGLFSPIISYFESENGLICFYNNQDNLYYHPTYGAPNFGYLSCSLLTEIVNADPVKNIIDVSPNPAKEFLAIRANNNNDNLSIEIFDVKGQMVLVRNELQDNSIIKISDLKNGLYFVRIIVNGMQIKTEKIIKE